MTNERDRFEAWAKDTMSLVKEPGGYKEATTHHAWRAWQAALTREQREGVVTFAVDDVRFDVPASIAEKVAAKLAPADNLPQPETPGAVACAEDAGEFSSDTAALAFLRLTGNGNPNVERAVERLRLSLTTPQSGDGVVVPMEPTEAMLDAALRLQGDDAFLLPEADKEADRRIGECAARWAIVHDAAQASLQPQPEAQGAVAGWSEAEQRATLVNSLRASKSWMTGYAEAFVDAFQDHARTTPPAPVDVRGRWREWLKTALQKWPEAEAALIATAGALGPHAEITQADIDWAKAALLDGQQAGVDSTGDSPEDHACFIEACADTFAQTGRPTTARTLREAATELRRLAALGGGGGGE